MYIALGSVVGSSSEVSKSRVKSGIDKNRSSSRFHLKTKDVAVDLNCNLLTVSLTGKQNTLAKYYFNIKMIYINVKLQAKKFIEISRVEIIRLGLVE